MARHVVGAWVSLALSTAAFAGDDPPSWPTIRASEVELTRQVPVDYPKSAAELGYRDVRCTVAVWVKRSGKPVRVDVLDCPDLLAPSVQEAVLQWRWNMRGPDGARQDARLDLAVRFRVTGGGGGFAPEERVIKTPDVFRQDTPEDDLDPRVLPVQVPDRGTVMVEGTQPWAMPTAALTLVERDDPTFPARAVNDGAYDATCTVNVVVGPAGRPSTLDVLGCDDVFAEAVRRAVERWRWEPPELDGERVEARARFTVVFRAYPDAYYDDPAPEGAVEPDAAAE